MKKTVLSLATMASAVVLCLASKASNTLNGSSLKRTPLILLMCLVAVAAGSPSPREAEAATRPNVLFILTDDQDPESMGRMANVKRLLAREGTSFTNAFATTATCCPSRVSFMRGQYTHNHGVLTNGRRSPFGGYERFRELGLQRSTIATWLDNKGYATFYAGKFLNQYGSVDILVWSSFYAVQTSMV
jgi:N-acetylglucosamine-6-sulfatase